MFFYEWEVQNNSICWNKKLKNRFPHGLNNIFAIVLVENFFKIEYTNFSNKTNLLLRKYVELKNPIICGTACLKKLKNWCLHDFLGQFWQLSFFEKAGSSRNEDFIKSTQTQI